VVLQVLCYHSLSLLGPPVSKFIQVFDESAMKLL
jgi:hypothetical protein